MSTVADAVKAATDMAKEGSGWGPAVRPAISPEAVQPNPRKANVYRRFILPPFNSDPDTLRQFEDGSPTPKVRVWPLPPQTGSSGNTTIINNASVRVSSGSSSSSSAGLAIKTATLNTGLISPGAHFTGSVALSKSFQLASLTASSACEIRLYGSAISQSFDLSRATDGPVPAETAQGLIVDVVLDTLPYSWGFQNVVGCNQDATQTTTVYVTVTNTTSSVLANESVKLAYIPLES